MKSYEWYQQLKKPSWAPPSNVFGLVWTFLYIIIAGSYGYVVYLYLTHAISFLILLPFLLNIFVNLIYTPIQFGLKNNVLAAIDVVLVVGTLLWALHSIYPHAHWVSFVNIPYLLWGCFATVLQLTITKLNWKK